MNKEEATTVKGIAILMMLFLHLFCFEDRCDYLIILDNRPLLTMLTEASNPVPLFLLISGYGLYSAYLKGDNNRYLRLAKLYIHYVTIFLFFWAVKWIVDGSIALSILDFIMNLLAYKTSIAPICWFLFPYIILSLLSHFLFKMLDRYSTVLILIISWGMFCISVMMLSKYGELLSKYNLITQIVSVLNLQFPFLLGAAVCKKQWYARIRKYLRIRFFCVILIVMLVLLMVLIKIDLLNPLYAFFLIPLLLEVIRGNFIKTFLSCLGKHSMNIWLIHGWFCYYIFGKELYSLRLPLLIFSSCLLLSWGTSILIDKITKPIEGLLCRQRIF